MEKTKKKGMNLPNKITCARLIIAAILLVILVLPWDQMGVDWPVYNVYGTVNANLLYLIAGGLFLIGSVSDFLDGYIARKYNLVTDFGKVTDAIADKVLVNGVLVILAVNSFIPLVVPVIIITRDIVVDAIKMQSGKKGKVVAASWPGKIKTICMMIGLTLVFFYNMPFEFINIRVDLFLLYFACIMAVVSAVEYYVLNKKILFSKEEIL